VKRMFIVSEIVFFILHFSVHRHISLPKVCACATCVVYSAMFRLVVAVLHKRN
jgi:hypothetical protein